MKLPFESRIVRVLVRFLLRLPVRRKSLTSVQDVTYYKVRGKSLTCRGNSLNCLMGL
jgi:hypothetical protein